LDVCGGRAIGGCRAIRGVKALRFFIPGKYVSPRNKGQSTLARHDKFCKNARIAAPHNVKV
jgi:hypothetical protein